MKFRVERDALADAVAWTARSLPARPAVPVLGGVLLEVTDSTLTVSGFDYEVSTQVEVEVHAAVAGRALVSGRLLAEISRALPPHPVDLAVDGPQGHDQLRQRPLHAAADAGRGLPDAADDADHRRRGRQRHLRHRGRARSRSRPAATTRCRCSPASGWRSRASSCGWPPPTATGWPSASCPGSPSRPSCPRQVLIPARTLSESAKTLTTGSEITLALAGGGAGEGMIGFAGPARRTTTRLLDAEFPEVPLAVPVRVVGHRATSRCRRCWRRSSGSRWSPTAAPRSGCDFSDGHAGADRRRRRRGPGRGAGRGPVLRRRR